MKKMIKRIVFAVIIVSLVLATGVVIKTGKFAKLEGYMYSFAAEITNSATDSNATSSNATSSNAQECATSSNATSSNAQECATSSNATSDKETNSNETINNTISNNSTNSNTQTTETNTQTSVKPSELITTEPDKNENIQTDLIYDNLENSQDKENTITIGEITEYKNEVSFLESHKMYVMIIGASILVIIIVSVILIVDNKTKKKINE